MTSVADVQERVVAAAAEAARATPGVAFLRPGLAELVRSTVTRRVPVAAASGVRITRRPAPGPEGDGAEGPGWRLHVQLAVAEGHQALAVTRAVRSRVTAAVTGALSPGVTDTPGTPPVRVTVTVTVIDIT